MILPTKHLKPEKSLLVRGSMVLEVMGESETISSIWAKTQGTEFVSSFNDLVIILDLLFAVKTIKLDGKIIRKNDASRG